MSLAQRITSQALSHRLRKLGQEFGHKMDRIAKLDARLRRIDPADTLNPSVIQKMALWMSSVGKLHDEENVILDEISAVEKKHQSMRKNKLLRKAGPSTHRQDDTAPEPKKKSTFWFWFLLYMLFFRNKAPSPAPAPKNG